MTGCYPHLSGGEGFFNLRSPQIPILPGILRKHDYKVGILGKLSHSTPYADFQWDFAVDQEELGHGRNPEVYKQYAGEFLSSAAEESKPFFLMLNSHDPHRPFYGNDKEEWYEGGNDPVAAVPSKVFSPDEIVTPGFLPDLPKVRQEIAEYYSSVRRCDDIIGAVLSLLEVNNLIENTLIIFLSDNAMAFPFAKTNCYLNSTKTPFIVKWPAEIKPGRRDEEHFISGIDILPTILEVAGAEVPAGVNGKSFLPLCKEEQQLDRELVFTQFHQTAGKRNYPMRCVQSKKFGYIYNPWSNGEVICIAEHNLNAGNFQFQRRQGHRIQENG